MTSRNINQFGGNWTQEKLQILEGYLKAYTTALKKQNFHLTYVDAFAGTGYVDINSRGTGQSLPLLPDGLDVDAAGVLKGSARLAIDVDDRPFDRLIFVEQNPEYALELQKIRAEFTGRKIQVQTANANIFLPEWCESRNGRLGVPWRRQRAVVFLDPFATEVDWQTVQSIAETQSVDLWILFPLSALSRIMPRHREPDESYSATLDRVYGGPEWRDLYTTREPVARQLNFFTGTATDAQTIRDDQQAIVEVYLDKLRTIFPAVASSSKWFYNSKNSPLFAFMFAAANPGPGGRIALDIANHLLRNW